MAFIERGNLTISDDTAINRLRQSFESQRKAFPGHPFFPPSGIGKSGTSRHHGYEGFLEFSNPRAVLEKGENDIVAAFHQPYGELTDAIIAGAFAGESK